MENNKKMNLEKIEKSGKKVTEGQEKVDLELLNEDLEEVQGGAAPILVPRK